MGDAALGQFNLEAVFALRLRAVQSRLGCLAECLLVDGFAMQRLLRLERAPGLGADASQGNADEDQLAAADLGHDGRRGEGKFVRGAVAQFEVDLLALGLGRGQSDKGDEVARLKHVFPLRRVAGDQEELADGNVALALRALDVNGRFESGEGDVHVGGVGGDAVFAGAQDGEGAVVAFDGGAAGAGLALIAGHGIVAEIHAAGALQKIAARGRHVAKLRGSPGEQGLGENGVVACNCGMMSQIGVADQARRSSAGRREAFRPCRGAGD